MVSSIQLEYNVHIKTIKDNFLESKDKRGFNKEK